jgi:hypothetical protein
MGELDCVLTTEYSGGGFIAGFCVDCPEVPAITAVPAVVVNDPLYGWNSGAYSQQTLDGDIYAQFNLPACVGTVVGFAPTRRSTDPVDIDYGFYCYKAAGREVWVVMERGVAKTNPVTRDPATDVFRIERRNGVVRYFFDGRTVYVSATPSIGAQVVVACMYAAQDGVN